MHDFVANISAPVKIKSQLRVTSLHWAESYVHLYTAASLQLWEHIRLFLQYCTW